MSTKDRPSKRAKLLDDSGESSGDEATTPGSDDGIKINSEYAKRFEYNKKRQEREQLEEKYGNASDTSDSDSEEEDDDADLIDAQNDAQFEEMLQALRSKDPRIYEAGVKFFDERTNGAIDAGLKQKDKSVSLRDYHRKNLLENGAAGQDEDADDKPKLPTYDEEQASLKRDLLKQADQDSDDADSDEAEEDDGFLKRKPKLSSDNITSKTAAPVTEMEVEHADEDPEGFLSKFMTSRAWVATEDAKFKPLESDDDDFDEAAEQYEDAYNFRFEDPARANEKIKTHSREAAAKYSVRREKPTSRKKTRELEQAAKLSAKEERRAEKDRLRRLKIDEAQEKLHQFKEAAGLSGQDISMEDWSKFLDAGFDDNKWEEEMRKRFGDDYYEGKDDGLGDETAKDQANRRSKLKRPKWDADIDIGDIVPDFDEEEERGRSKITLTDDEADSQNGDNDEDGQDDSEDDNDDKVIDGARKTKPPSKKQAIAAKASTKHRARLERAHLEHLVDQHLTTDLPPASAAPSKGFLYRETSPSTFGLSAREILMADDTQLNEYAGLKKLAAFRDAGKKKKDKKFYSKKARLRQWRKDTFGDESGPVGEYGDFLRRKAGIADDVETQEGGRKHREKRRREDKGEVGPSKKKRRSRKRAITNGEA